MIERIGLAVLWWNLKYTERNPHYHHIDGPLWRWWRDCWFISGLGFQAVEQCVHEDAYKQIADEGFRIVHQSLDDKMTNTRRVVVAVVAGPESMPVETMVRRIYEFRESWGRCPEQ